MKIWSFWAILLFLSSIGLIVAQEEAKNDGDIESKRHIEVRVELNNDSELEGIVVDGRFYEKYDDKKNRWKVMPSRKGSGLRLWHVEKAEGYICLSYETDIRRIEEIGKKSQRELEELRYEIQKTKDAEQAKAREDDLKNLEKQGETKGEEKTSTKSENKDELSPEQITKYEEILQKFPEDRFSLNKTVSSIKMRMASGILLGKDHKDFLMEYEFWREAVKWKKKEAPLKEVTEEQVIEAQKLLAKFPLDSFSIPAKVQSFVRNSAAEVPLAPLDEEWLSSLDTWLDAQIIVKLGEKMAEAKGTEKTSKPE
ncbi:MAG: hypothetical protein AABZ60_11220 [Planctomycetota bacterium]